MRKEEERKKALDARLRFEQERMEQERLEQEERERRYREREEQIEEHRHGAGGFGVAVWVLGTGTGGGGSAQPRSRAPWQEEAAEHGGGGGPAAPEGAVHLRECLCGDGDRGAGGGGDGGGGDGGVSSQGEQQEEDDRQQLRKSESEVEVSAAAPCPAPVSAPQAGWDLERVKSARPGVPPTGRGSQPAPSPQEAAAIIAQRPDNPRDFFKQQERVASGSSDAISPGSHRTGEGLGGHGGAMEEVSAVPPGRPQLAVSQRDRVSPLLSLWLWVWVLGVWLQSSCSAPPRLLRWPRVFLRLQGGTATRGGAHPSSRSLLGALCPPVCWHTGWRWGPAVGAAWGPGGGLGRKL